MSYQNLKQFKQRRRNLRRGQTDAEAKLWSRLRSYRFFGYKFYRQYSVGPYILDFYCHKLKLAVEVDGSQHMITQAYDQSRAKFLEKQGIRTIRYWNTDVLDSIDEVLED